MAWYKDAVFYEVPIKSFYDSNGDGIGDLAGLTQKLDYLQRLEVDCLWLLPMYPSPLRDDGYDIADFCGIHPNYGTLADFDKFIAAAHERKLKVIADLVLNHTSDQHPWFQASRRGGPKRDWYVWSDDPTRYKDARIIFTDTEKSNWTFDPEAKKYYWHRFFSHQPDLNFDNAEVRAEMLNVVKFWLDRGLDGFRVDAVPYLFEREGTSCENLPETHAYLKELRAYVDAHWSNRVLLAEANQLPAEVRPYFGGGAGDECHMAFHFPLMPRIFMAIRREDRTPIVDTLLETPPIPDLCQWGLFLRNHDELTLEMVTPEEREYMYKEFAHLPRMRLNVGIRRRLAPLMNFGRRQIELLSSLIMSLPGSPILYYGDEIGMGDNIYLGDRDGVRTPMQWSADRNAGFSKADPERLYAQPVLNPVCSYQAINVESQERLPGSLLSFMKRLIDLRRRHPVFGRGTFAALEPANRHVLSYLREQPSQVVLVAANLSRFAQPVELELSRFHGWTPVEMFGHTRFPPISEKPYALTLAPHGFLWFRLER
ncbi:MAG: maltose alpha-D-glucosyltransferase [Elusimicrobiota bacterium]|nr:MAG: maltose alpha-D-glucosyltransferase [Elusimicrobiota bacterium]